MCTVEAYRYICVLGAKRGKRLGEASPFPAFLSLIHILPICFDSAQVLYIIILFKEHPSLFSDILRETYIHVKYMKRKSSNLLSTSGPIFVYAKEKTLRCSIREMYSNLQ